LRYDIRRTVTGVQRLASADVCGLLEIVEEAVGAGYEPVGRHVLDPLRKLIGCPDGVYVEEGPGEQLVVRSSDLEDPPGIAKALAAFAHQRPTAATRFRPEDRVVLLSERITRRELHRLDFYRDVMRPMGVEDELVLQLPAPPDRRARFSLIRAELFGERERTILELLAPHLARARQRMLRRGRAALSDRQWEVLRLVARGHTNKEIAQLLDIKPDTVRKHLENVFEQLGVHTRTAAAAEAFGPGAGPTL
jgi:DNA-binding CsgD family transcriptional regulator